MPITTAIGDPYTSCTSTSSALPIWNGWCQVVGTSATNTTWISWINNCTTSGGTAQYQAGLLQPQLTAEQTLAIQQAQQQAQAQQVAHHEEQQKKRDAAHKKSMELLRENLSPAQLKALDKHGWFLVEGGKSKKIYRINANHHAGNILEMDVKKAKPVAKYCVHASYEFALGDHLLAQALSLKLDEDHIIGKANRTALAA